MTVVNAKINDAFQINSSHHMNKMQYVIRSKMSQEQNVCECVCVCVFLFKLNS